MQNRLLPSLHVIALSALILVCASVTASGQEATVGLLKHESSSFVGYTLFAPGPSTTTYLIDNYGRVVHTWPSAHNPALSAYLLDNGNLLRTTKFDVGEETGAGVEEIAWDGTVVWTYDYYGESYRRHHDIEPLPNGNVLVLARESKTPAEAIAAGRDSLTMSEDELLPEYIVEIEPTGPTTGNIVWEWHAWDHLIQDFDSTKPNYGVVEEHPELIDLNYMVNTKADWIHANSLDYNPELDQIVISCRLFDEIWIIDHTTTTTESSNHTGGIRGMGGDILYRWGNPQAYGAGTADDRKLFMQHDAQWIEPGLPGEGHILIFNNGKQRPGPDYSTVEEIVTTADVSGDYPQPALGAAHGPTEALWTFTATPAASFFSGNLSGAQRLPNGNTLVCEGRFGRFFEVNTDDEIVWEYVNPVTDLGILEQGQSVPAASNSVFKINRFASDHPGLVGRELSPGAPVEIYPISISGTSHSPTDPTWDDSVFVTTTITDDIAVTSALLYASTGSGYSPITLYDDGNHGDEMAGDDIYGGAIPPVYDSFVVSYYIAAESDSASLTNDPGAAPTVVYSYSCSPGAYVVGDVDRSGGVDIDDVVYLISYIFTGGPAPAPLVSGDADCSGGVDIDDVVYLIGYIFSGGFEPGDPDGDGEPDC